MFSYSLVSHLNLMTGPAKCIYNFNSCFINCISILQPNYCTKVNSLNSLLWRPPIHQMYLYRLWDQYDMFYSWYGISDWLCIFHKMFSLWKGNQWWGYCLAIKNRWTDCHEIWHKDSASIREVSWLCWISIACFSKLQTVRRIFLIFGIV